MLLVRKSSTRLNLNLVSVPTPPMRTIESALLTPCSSDPLPRDRCCGQHYEAVGGVDRQVPQVVGVHDSGYARGLEVSLQRSFSIQTFGTN
jgi:hypothetical protein